MSLFVPIHFQTFISKLVEPVNRFFKKGFVLFSGKGAQQGYWAATDQGIISLTNFVAAIILGRAVSPEEFGIYAVGFFNDALCARHPRWFNHTAA